jgi:transcriptional regulator with XRE-family HTH domain
MAEYVKLETSKKRAYQTKTLKRKETDPIKKLEPPVIDYKLIGKRIKQARIHTGITQEYLSELVDVTPAFIGHIERGERSVSLVTILKIATVLSVSTDYLFSMEQTTEDIEIANAIVQMINHRPLETKKAVLDIISAALKHLE